MAQLGDRGGLRMIEVRQVGASDPMAFEVTVSDDRGHSHHHVRLARKDFDRLAGDRCPPEHLVAAAFRFLLDREPKEAILASFDISVITRYFPDFEKRLPDYIAAPDRQ